jgi:hypothetical protein
VSIQIYRSTSSDFEIYLVPSPSEARQDFNNAGCLPVALLPTILHCILLIFLHQSVARMSVDIIRRNRGPSSGQWRHPRQNFKHYGQHKITPLMRKRKVGLTFQKLLVCTHPDSLKWTPRKVTVDQLSRIPSLSVVR